MSHDYMIIKGLRNIGQHLGVTRSSILRWHTQYDDPTLNFPLIPRHTGKGANIMYWIETELVNQWLIRLSHKDAIQARMALRSHIRRSVCRKINQAEMAD